MPRRTRTPWRKRAGAPKRTLGGRTWYKMRRQVLVEQRGSCALCGFVLVDGEWALDHITPLSKGGSDERANLQAICHPCHEKKSARDRGHRPRRTIGPDGYPVED